MLLLCPAGHSLREDFTFRHSFSSEVNKLLKASPGQVVVVQPEKFRSKYEPASHTLTVKVQSAFKFMNLFNFCGFIFILPLAELQMVLLDMKL